MGLGGGHKYFAYSHLGIMFAMIMGISVFAGYKADEKFGTTPLFTLLGFFFGFGAGFYQLYREIYPPVEKKDD